MEESNRLESLANWYIEKQLDFDTQLIYFRYKTLAPHLQGPFGLELGSAEGQMTKYLINHFDHLTIVEGSYQLLQCIPSHPNLTKVHSLFEEFRPVKTYDSIILEHILEHVQDPVGLLNLVKTWLAPNGKIFLGVPNANSIHRLVAVKMGLLTHPAELNSRDLALGHRRVYNKETLKQDIQAAGLNISLIGGVFFKPLSNQQIQENWSEEMILGFYELGKDFPEHAAELYAICH